MVKYRAYDKVTGTRYLVQSIDFKFGKIQLVPPGKECNLRYIRVIDQVVLERFLNRYDKNKTEIYEGDLFSYYEQESLFSLSEELVLYNTEVGVVDHIDKVILDRLEVVSAKTY